MRRFRPSSSLLRNAGNVPSRVVDLSLRRAATGLILAAAAQVLVCVLVARPAYPNAFLVVAVPLFFAAVGAGSAGLLLTTRSTTWIAVVCGAAAGFSVAASVAVAGQETGGSNVAEPMIGLGVFGAGMSPSRAARAAALGLIVVHRGGLALAGTGTTAEYAGLGLLECGSFLAALVGTGIIRRLARPLDERAAEYERAAAADAAATAANLERRERARILHDVGLPTFALLAHGAVGDAAALRARCRAEAEILRGHIADWQSGPRHPRDAADALAAEFAAAGLTVEVSGSPAASSGPAPPLPVGVLLTRAVRAALSNVLAHSGVDRAEVRVVAHGAGVGIDVVDRGTGFDPALTPAGRLGLRGSLEGRLGDIGGAIEVRPTDGGGTTVAIRWPA